MSDKRTNVPTLQKEIKNYEKMTNTPKGEMGARDIHR